jgi:tungstate transport system substrate-binding protein
MTKRSILTLAAFLALLFAAIPILAACGDDSSPSSTPTATFAASSTAVKQPSPAASPTHIGGSMILATTTSTQDTGLLDTLVPMFEKETGTEVKVIAVGTGAALDMSAKGNADAVLVHAYTAEQKYVQSGDLIDGKLVMHNDFVIVGPESDPAHVKDAKTIDDAMKAIAATGPFISRGDDSGTNKEELTLWKDASIDPKTAVNDYQESGQGMGATLNIADQKDAYTLTDRGTYLSLKSELKLQVLFEGAKNLLNIYHVYEVNPEKHSGVKIDAAKAFVAFMVRPDVQQIIGNFKKAEYGRALFIPDAGKSMDSLGN